MTNNSENTFLTIEEKDLKKETLESLIESYVLQEGTDYGLEEYSLEEKVSLVLKQIREKKAWIVYDFKSEECFISSQNPSELASHF